MLTGTVVYLIAFQDVSAPWTAIATLLSSLWINLDRLIFLAKIIFIACNALPITKASFRALVIVGFIFAFCYVLGAPAFSFLL